MPTTRCKFSCLAVTKRRHHIRSEAEFSYDAEFYAVAGNSPENKQFFASTPSGKINVATIRENVFEPGKEYYVDFTLVEEAAASPTG